MATTPTNSAQAPLAPSVLSTLNDDGSRRWIKPRPSPGRFLTARRAVAYTLILIFTLLPYIRVNGRPFVLLDLASRRFTIFGYTFLPTDTLLLALLLVGIAVSIFLVTALLGRIWCGWACPQTVYMEFVFRPIERLFEGRPGSAKKGLLGGTGAGKALKFVVYLLVALYLAHTFLAYFVGVDKLAQWVRRSPLEHPSSFVIMAAVTGLMLFDFGYFREQICIIACPYGRLQSVLLDRDSLVISYDAQRGEPRGKARRTPPPAGDVQLPVVPTPAAVGDCVDCHLCVTTCPTGIDIRNGLQMECIGCAQCIDACDAVMTKLNRPKGLIRYSSQSAMAHGRRRVLRPRTLAYPAILAVIATLFVTVLANKAPADVALLRGLGAPFTRLPSGEIANPIRLKVTNRTDAPVTYRFDAATVKAAGPAGAGGGGPGAGELALRISTEEDPFVVKAGEARTVPALVIAPESAFAAGGGRLDIRVTVSDGDSFTTSRPYRMMGPGSAAGGGGARAEQGIGGGS